MRGRILVVDDADHIRELFQEILADEGYDVVTAATALADPSDFAGRKPDVIVLDYLFGTEPHGEQMLEQLAACPATRHIPVILCTASTTAIETLEPDLTARGGGVLQKPFVIDDLLLIIQQVLSRGGARASRLPIAEVRCSQDQAGPRPALVQAEVRPLLAL